MIKSICLNNFKSFYSFNEIKFSSGMNSIVGPNGSGKSNILDAILFVFCGKSSSLRIKLLKQLISHGCDSCFVEVIFDGFVLKRAINHKGTSEYYINNQLKTQLQYNKFLQENHLSGQQFIILQGEVEQIAQMKPKASTVDEIGLLEYIEQEEHYEIQKAQLEKKSSHDVYRQKQSDLEASELLLRDIYTYIDFDSLVNYIFQLHIELLLQNIEIHIRTLAIQQMDNQISQLCDKQSLFNKLLESLIVDINNQKNQKETLLQKRKGLGSLIDENLKQITQLSSTYNQDEFLDLQIQLNKLTNLLEKNTQNLSDYKNDIEKFQIQLPQKQEKVETLNIEKNKCKETYIKMRDELSINAKFYMRKKNDLELKLMPFNSEIKQFKDQIHVYQIELERTGKTPQSIITQLVQMRQRHDETILEEQKIEQEIQPILAILENMKLRKKEYEKYIQDIKNQEKECEQKLKVSSQKIMDFNDQQLQNNKQSEIIRKLYQAKQKNEIRMIGRLGDLGDIEVQYQDALARILPELEYIIVENSSDAFDVIEYSKIHKIGRIQIIVAETLPQCNISQLTYPPGAQRLFDLITCEEQLKNIFYYFLRDTVVVNTIADAIKINKMPSHKNKWRMVTKNTEIFDVDGSIITKQKNMGFGIKYKFNNELDPYEKDRLLNENKEQRNRLDSIKNQLLKYEQGFNQLLEDEEKTNLHYKQKVVDRDILIEQINNNITQMEITEETLKQSHLNLQRSEELNREIYILEKKVQKLELDKGQDQIEFEEVEQKLKEIANQNIRGAKENLEQVSFDLDNAEMDLNKTQSNIQSYAKQIISLEQQVQDESQRQEQLRVKIQNMQNLREKINFETKEIELQNKQLENQIELIQQEIQQVDQLIREIQKQIKEGQLSIDDLEQEKSQISLKKSIEKKQHIEYSQRKEDVNKKFRDFLSQIGETNLAKIQELQESMFVKKLNEAMSNLRNQYSQRFQEFDLPQLIEVIPKQMIMNVPNLDEYGNQYCLYIQQIVEIYQSLDKQKQISFEILNVFLKKCMEYEERKELSQKFYQEYFEKQKTYEELYSRRRIQFSQRFDKINKKLKEIYFQLSNEGDAELRLIDSVDPFSEGIEYTVKPKNKGWRQIYKLSGGEKTLASLSLMFATHIYSNQNNKIYIFDEIDASLDLQNVGKVANLLKDLKSQIIIVSLRPQMFEVANSLIGVYMPQNSEKTSIVHLL